MSNTIDMKAASWKTDTVLQMENLRTFFYTQKGVVKAVNDVSLQIERGKTLALVGESGCGKSVTSLSIMRLISKPGRIESGRILFEGEDLLTYSDRRMRSIRGNRISMIFQEPMTSLNPVFRVGEQIVEVFLTHEKIKKAEAYDRAVELLKMVGIPAPEKRITSYPHELSGGMRQRVMIAMALASPDPGLMIADEPTTALDVTIQAQILQLMNELQQRVKMSLLLITHDMGVVAETADHVVVMYAGKKVEEADINDIFEHPQHPYTVGLLNSIPANEKYRGRDRLEAIPGVVPNLLKLHDGCPFENRCVYAQDICRRKFPERRVIGENHEVYCHFAGELDFS